jgi:hypothetical protein
MSIGLRLKENTQYSGQSEIHKSSSVLIHYYPFTNYTSHALLLPNPCRHYNIQTMYLYLPAGTIQFQYVPEVYASWSHVNR